MYRFQGDPPVGKRKRFNGDQIAEGEGEGTAEAALNGSDGHTRQQQQQQQRRHVPADWSPSVPVVTPLCFCLSPFGRHYHRAEGKDEAAQRQPSPR